MSAPSRPRSHAVCVLADREAMTEKALRCVQLAATSALLAYGRFDLALAGGSTPRALYERLAGEPRASFEGWHFWWGDERFVAPDHEDSNARMAREAFLDPLEIPAERVHPVPCGQGSATEAAALYEAELKSTLDGRGFGLVLLGMGADGHTASLFPGTPALEESQRLVSACTPPSAPHERVTLTLPAIAQADRVVFLVAGADKSTALREVFETPERFPAGRAASTRGTTSWLLDSHAARLLAN